MPARRKESPNTATVSLLHPLTGADRMSGCHAITPRRKDIILPGNANASTSF
jgi:hypothetical protein